MEWIIWYTHTGVNNFADDATQEKSKNPNGRRANEFTNTKGRYQRVDSESKNHLKIRIHSVFINSFACQRPAEGISIEIGEILIIEFIAFQLYD